MLTPVLLPAAAAIVVALSRMARASGVTSRLSAGGRRRRLPARVRVPLARALERAVVSSEPEDAFGLWLASAAVAGSVGSLAGSGPAVFLAMLVLGAGPAALYLGRHRHHDALRRSLPGLLEDVARELRSGGTVATAVDRLGRSAGTGAAEMRAVARRTALGLSLQEALGGWMADHRGHPTSGDVTTAAGSLAVAANLGGRSADALDALAEALRDRHRALAEARAQAAQGRVSAVVVGALPVVALGLSLVGDGDAARVLVTHPAGRMALAVGLVLETAGVVWMRRIVRVVP